MRLAKRLLSHNIGQRLSSTQGQSRGQHFTAGATESTAAFDLWRGTETLPTLADETGRASDGAGEFVLSKVCVSGCSVGCGRAGCVRRSLAIRSFASKSVPSGVTGIRIRRFGDRS